MKKSIKTLTGLAVLLASSQAFALTYTEYTDRAAFEAAIADETTEDFNAEATGEFDTRAFAGFTVTNLDPGSTDPNDGIWTEIAPGTNSANIDGSNFLELEAIPDRLEAMSLDFDVPVGAIGFDWNNTDGSGDDARMVIVVDGQEFIFGTGRSSGFFGVVADEGAFGTVVFGDTVGGGTRLAYLGLDNITFTAADPSTTARFAVTKTFENQATGEVDVTITCNAGLPLTQSFTIAGGGPGVTFTVTDLPTGGATCEIVETTGVDNYTASYDNGTTTSATSCEYTNVTSGSFTCAIANLAADASLEVTKEWVVSADNEDVVDMTADLQVRCSVDFDGAGYDGMYYDDFTLVGQTASETVTGIETHLPGNGNYCYVIETGSQPSGVVTTNGCGTQATPIVLTPGAEAGCTITNTIFFEGIPTLSQYGMAIMALLMLGIGFVGFRRFV